MDRAILVTGASGFIGSHLVEMLRRQGRLVYTHRSRDGDIADCALEFEGVEHVFHLAAKTFVPDSWHSPRGFYRVNVLGTVNVLEFCRRESASLTYISSYVYGKPQRLPIGEDHPLAAFNPYSQTKILAEDTVRFYGSAFGVRAAVVRPFNIYGPGQAEHFLIPTLIRQALNPECCQIEVADSRPRRDFIHVHDLTALLAATLASPPGSVYNAGSGRSTSIQELVGLINQVTGHAKPLHSAETSRPAEVLDVVAGISKADRELNWQPRVSLLEGLRETVKSLQMTASP
jgi:nucleoside-diphosphate-sugar epimerase